MAPPRFSRAQIEDAFTQFEATVDHAARTSDWDGWVAHYTPDVDYIEHAAGTMKGREQVRDWIRRTMTTFPGSHMTAFPTLWHVIDTERGRVICELDNPMRDPGDGTRISATNISIISYAGDGCGAVRRTSTTRCASSKPGWPGAVRRSNSAPSTTTRRAWMRQYGGDR